MKLIVTEKPSVARDIARVLGAKQKKNACYEGEGLRVTWCLGHVAELVEPAEYEPTWKSWRADTLPMLPESFKLRPVKRTIAHWRDLKGHLTDKSIELVINACDAGREGELIFRYAAELARCRKPTQRMWLSSMTDQAIRDAWAKLRPGAELDPLADAARCRSEADWLVGLNATRALTLLGRQGGGSSTLFSVGRVQTPTLAMIVDREREIQGFVPEPFWQVFATFDTPEGTYEGLYHHGEHNALDRLTDAESAEGVAATVDGRPGVIRKLEQKQVTQRPPLLFDLTGLQRLANRRFGLSAAATLAAAQSLYETHKLITYPRTDSNCLTTDMEATLPDRLRGIAVGPFDAFCQHLLAHLPLKTGRRIINDKEVNDHHAIIPTGRTPNLDRLSRDEARVFELIALRFIAAFYPDAIFATTRIETVVEAHLFVTRGRVCVDPGWQVVEPPWQPAKKKDKEGEEGSDDDDRALPRVAQGQEVHVADTRVHQGMTQPPRRFNEGTLLGAMENAGQELDEEQLKRAMKDSGLGTPATRASVIEILLRREYILRDGRNLLPTAVGCALIDALPPTDLRSARMTGQWEARLNAIAHTQLTRGAFMADVRQLTARLTHEILNNTTTALQSLPSDDSSATLGPCPRCGAPVSEGFKAFTCQTGRTCGFALYKTIAHKKVSAALAGLLLNKRRSRRLKGFRSKAGKPFEAALVLQDDGSVTFDFSEDGDAPSPTPKAPARPTSKTAPAPKPASKAAPKPASKPASKRATKAPRPRPPEPVEPRTPGASLAGLNAPALPCPRCNQGQIIAGRRGWGCSRFREGCRFVLPFEHAGRLLTDQDAAELIEHQATAPLAGLLDPDGATRNGRLLLDHAADALLRVELAPVARQRRAAKVKEPG